MCRSLSLPSLSLSPAPLPPFIKPPFVGASFPSVSLVGRQKKEKLLLSSIYYPLRFPCLERRTSSRRRTPTLHACVISFCLPKQSGATAQLSSVRTFPVALNPSYFFSVYAYTTSGSFHHSYFGHWAKRRVQTFVPVLSPSSGCAISTLGSLRAPYQEDVSSEPKTPPQ